MKNINNENWPVCPEVIGLTGSTKRNWLDNHADYVIAIYEFHGPEGCCQYFRMKLDTLQSFLNRHDKGDKKLMRQDEITRNRIYALSENVNNYVKDLERQSVDLDDQINRQNQLTDIMIRGHEAESKIHDLIVQALKSTLYFTEDIYTDRINDSGLTPSITEQNSIKRIKAGPTSVGRHFISNKRETGKLHTSRSGKTHGTLRARYNAKKRDRHA